MKLPQYKWTVLLLLFGMFSSTGEAQIDLKIHVGPQLSNYWNNTDSEVSTHGPYLAFSTDLRVAFNTTNKLQFEAGMGYNQKGDVFKINFDGLRWPNQHNGNGGFDPSIDPMETTSFPTKYVNVNRQIELPLQVNYFFKTPSEGWFALGGLRPNLTFDSKQKSVYKDRSNNVVRDQTSYIPKKFNVFLRGGIGYEIPFAKLGLSFSTFFDLQLLTVIDAPTNDLKPSTYAGGLLLGLRF